MVVNVQTGVFRDVTPCSLVEICQRLEYTYCPFFNAVSADHSETLANFHRNIRRHIQTTVTCICEFLRQIITCTETDD